MCSEFGVACCSSSFSIPLTSNSPLTMLFVPKTRQFTPGSQICPEKLGLYPTFFVLPNPQLQFCVKSIIMKIDLRFFTLIISTSFFTLLNAQTPPNSGFEQWNTTSDKNPTGWSSLNWTTQFGAPYTCSKTNDAHSGNFAVKLATTVYVSDTVDGLMFTGEWPSGGYPRFGYAFNRRPLKLTGYYKFTTASGDSSLMAVRLTLWNDTFFRQDTVGDGVFFGKATASYTYFEIPINYYKGGKPDTASIIILGSSKSTLDVRGNPGNTLYLDDLAYEYSTGIKEEILPEPAASIYPNPSNGMFHIEYANREPVTIKVFDLYGKELLVTEVNEGSGDVDLTGFADGVYSITILSRTMNRSFKVTKATTE